ncbi:CD109 antigen-like isoform X3 [Littorina saxatilis]|uniref:CD109 antigen-like n=1 Tax=Littorina saxatilis TaxID=31220 RepID=A0AAN9C092_9CAEN
MGLTLYLALLVTVLGQAYSSYVALAPSEFHPGWKYAVQLTVTDTKGQADVTVNGNIFNSDKTSVGASSITLSNGETKKLEIQIGANIALSSYTLQLDGTGGLTFSNSTPIQLAPLTHLTFIQTDKKMYKASQLIRFRVMIVDKDLIPQKMAKNITIENPAGSVLAKFHANGSKAVYENTYQLTEFPDLGQWKIKVDDDQLEFKVDEYVLPKFEVTADVTPGYLLKGSEQNKITVGVTAKYLYGKGVRGDIKLTVMDVNGKLSQTIDNMITDPSGMKNVEIDLTKELTATPDYYDSNLEIKVEVTDETQRTYETTVSVRVVEKPVKIEFDQTRTETVFRPGMPIKAVVKITDPDNKALGSTFLENPLVFSLVENRGTGRTPMTHNIRLTAAQTVAEYTFENIPLSESFTLQATLTVNGKTYNAPVLNLQKYETLGNATLDARWTADNGMLTVGNQVGFRVDVSDPSHFQGPLTYMIVSRGNIQMFGSVMPDQNKNIQVTTDMCPQGRLVVYGITSVVTSVSAVPEVIADSLELTLEHCQDKKVTPSASPSGEVRTGTNTTLTMQVAWTDTTKADPIGMHDVYMLAVDKGILSEGHNDFTPEKVEEELKRFNLDSSSGGGFEPGPFGRAKRSIMPPMPMGRDPQSTGELLKEVGLETMSDLHIARIPIAIWFKEDSPVLFNLPAPVPKDGQANAIPEFADASANAGSAGGALGGAPPKQVTVRKDFPETWIWKTAQTDDSGSVSFVEKLPDSITSWVISTFAVRDNSELGVTAQLLELNAFNPFFVSLNLPYSIRRTEKFELRATVFNYESGDLETTVTLAESNDYTISGGSVKTTMVKANNADSVTFMIIASTVGVINLKVTATAQRANNLPITDVVERKLIVKPEGVERMRAITFPVFLSNDGMYNQNVTLDFSPWTLADVVQDSRRVAVKITGDMMGNALEGIDDLVQIPTGCGEQNMITTVPNIYAWAYLDAVDELSDDFKVKASEYMKLGYTKETQQYRWMTGQNKGGYSAFGTSDQAASTWLTAFVLKSFAQAKNYISDTVDLDILDMAVEFLFRRQNPDGLFFEQGRVIHDDMQGGTGAGDALSVYILICMLEAKDYGVEIDETKLSSAIEYVKALSNGQQVKQRQFLAAITAYALALDKQENPETKKGKVMQLIRDVNENGGAPWRKQKESTTVKPEDSYYYHPPPGPSDIEVTAYCILAYTAIGEVAEGRPLILWLQKQQNSNGGFRSTQDTVMALQAISKYAANFSRGSADPRANVDVTTLDPVSSPKRISVDRTNTKLLQRVELPDETNKVNIKVSGTPDSLAVIKVVWNFYTAPETGEMPPSETGTVDPNSRKLKVTTESKMVRPGFHNVKACVKPEEGLEYDNMMVMTLDMPSGFQPEDLQVAKKQNPSVVRLEQDKQQLHFYMSQPREECMNVVMEQTVMVENLKPGSAALYAYYKPDIKSEAPIQLAVMAPCQGPNCDTGHASSQAALSRLLLAACLCLLISLCLAL